ncbi:MAG: NADH-quinone oxidoreductase subunit N [Chloroflexi bacterium HGW-Chloroflexi-4]|jgi:NADH-quinone oxidoreductase subunit N|nr:MAG: NADH-quinone oxidoreductase subunit N [Chloroflexi bacterium HGW-Chloroflexi-4]
MTLTVAQMTLAIMPELLMIVLAGVLIVISIINRDKCKQVLGCITAGGMILAIVSAFLFAMPKAEPILMWGGMLRLDSVTFVFRLIFLFGAAVTAIFSCTEETIRCRPEFYMMLVFSTLGMSLMAASCDLIMLFLAIETASIPLYVMAGIKVKEEKSVEAGLKYFLFGGMSSAIMVYGFSLIYGFSGTTQLFDIAQGVIAQQVPLAGVVVAVVLVLAGFAFKISAAPFHFWAPDVYEGAPTSVTGFLSTASKAAGFAALIRVLMILFDANSAEVWQALIAALAVASMFTGNLVAIPQKNIKRLLAYSSIAQAGYILVGLTSHSTLGVSGAIYYLMAYLVTNLALFAIVGWIGRKTGSDSLAAYAGLSKRSPGLALAMLIGLLSLGGIPPFGGFFAKLLVFGAAVESGWAWLAIVGVINSVIGLYYYLRVLKIMYVDEPAENTPLKVKEPLWLIGLILCLVLVTVMGVVLAPWFGISNWAAIGF